MLLALFFLLHALAAAPPSFPTLPEAVPGDCAATRPIYPGKPAPPWLSNGEDSNVKCGGVLVPTNVMAYYADVESHAKELQTNTSFLEYKVAHLTMVNKELSKPPPWHQRPGVQWWVGAASTLAIVVVTGYALEAAAAGPTGGGDG